MSLFVIRHGETPLNSERKFNGEVDERLSDYGILQAAKAGVQLQQKNIEIVYCSPLTRTKQTLELLNLNRTIPIVFDDRLVERIEGSLSGQPITDDILKNVYLNFFPEVYVEGLESLTEVFLRVFSVLDEIEKKFKDKNVLIVTHGCVGRAIYHYFNNLPDDGKLTFSEESYQKNCEIREYDFSKKSKWWKGELKPFMVPEQYEK